MKYTLYILLIFYFFVFSAVAQEPVKKESSKEKTELRLNLNEDGSHYIKTTFSNQVWFKFNQSNPGTQVLGAPQSQTLTAASILFIQF